MVYVNVALATVGKFFNSSAFAVAYIYSAELVPTGVRNIAVGTSSMCARIGSALAPFVVDLLVSPHIGQKWPSHQNLIRNVTIIITDTHIYRCGVPYCFFPRFTISSLLRQPSDTGLKSD